MSYKIIKYYCHHCGKETDFNLISWSDDFRAVVCSPICLVNMMIKRGALAIGDHPTLLKRIYT